MINIISQDLICLIHGKEKKGILMLSIWDVFPHSPHSRLIDFVLLSFLIFFMPGSIHHIVIFFIQVGFIDSPSRVFNSPYSSALSLEYAPINRMSEFKV